MNEEIQHLLRNVRLRKMAKFELAAARKASPPYTDLVTRLLRGGRAISREEGYKPALSTLTCPSSEPWSSSRSTCNRASPAARSVNSLTWSSFPRVLVAGNGTRIYYWQCRVPWRAVSI